MFSAGLVCYPEPRRSPFSPAPAGDGRARSIDKLPMAGAKVTLLETARFTLWGESDVSPVIRPSGVHRTTKAGGAGWPKLAVSESQRFCQLG
jgi:hypothetical protein